MEKILFLKPVFHEKIWGGTELKNKFGYDIPSSKTGECWAISAHSNGDCEVINGNFVGEKLSELWTNSKELFGNIEGDVFPLLSKILDANNDLSVQVHPNDEYAKLNENGELGKTECWYILDCNEDAEMILGHNAKNKEDLIQMIEKGRWKELLRIIKIKPGDFFYVPSGTIHALCSGTLVLETQQSSDTTYRVYDYDRIDDNGKKRELHIDKSIEVTSIPHKELTPVKKVKMMNNAEIITYLESKYFSVHKWNINGKQDFTNDKPFLLVNVLEGEGKIDDNVIKKGDHFIICNGYDKFQIEGQIQLMISHI